MPENYQQDDEKNFQPDDEKIFRLDDEKTKAYEKRSSRYQNTKDSAIALFIVGGLGIISLILAYFQVIPITIQPFSLSSVFSVVLCVIFLICGVFSLKRSFTLKAEAEEEDAFTEAIAHWLEEHIDSSIVTTEEELSEADLYFLRCQRAKELLLKDFPNMDADYMDSVLDENYDRLFSKK